MQIENINIESYKNSIIEFIRKCDNKSIILIKNEELARFMQKHTKTLKLREISEKIFKNFLI